MIKKIFVAFIALFTIGLIFVGCTKDKEVIYIDSVSGKPIKALYKMNSFVQDDVKCNEFGMAYYKNQNAYGSSYTPVLAIDALKNKSNVSCKEYENYINGVK